MTKHDIWIDTSELQLEKFSAEYKEILEWYIRTIAGLCCIPYRFWG